MPKPITVKIPLLHKYGPVCKVILSPSAPTIKQLRSKRLKIPTFTALGLIDTGANISAVSEEVVKKLNLIPRGTARVYTSHQKAEVRNEYDVSLKFNLNIRNQIRISVLRVLAGNFQKQTIDCLLGRDVLQFGVFTYDGPNNQIMLMF